MEKPERQQANRATGRVNENVGNLRRSRRHENLMKFIARRVKKNNQQRAADLWPRPRRQIVFRLMQRAPQQQREHGVFGQMAAFADEVMQGLNFRLRHVREEPAQKRLDEQRAVFGGFRIAGAGKNHGHPEQRRQPVFQKRAELEHTE